MLPVFLKTLPFFALVGLGYLAVRLRLFTAEGTAWLTRFVFFFPLSALLFGFSANLSIGEIFDPMLASAYMTGCFLLYAFVMAVGLYRKEPLAHAAMEAQTATIGNTGFLGIPLLVSIIGPQVAPPMLLMLMLDSVVFAALITVLVSATRGGSVVGTLIHTIRGLAQNPMILALGAGFLWSTTIARPLPGPVQDFVTMLSAAATPAALFAIGGSLASRSTSRPLVAAWLSLAKLLLLPLACLAASFIFPLSPFTLAVMMVTAGMPVAGNVYMLAQHYGVAPQRVSTAILISTAGSIVTLPLLIHWMLE